MSTGETKTLFSTEMIRKWLVGRGCWGGGEAALGSWERASWGGNLSQG